MTDKLVPMYHKKCGGIVLYTVGKFKTGDVVTASRVVFRDGDHPVPGEAFGEPECVLCHKRVKLFNDVEYSSVEAFVAELRKWAGCRKDILEKQLEGLRLMRVK